MIFFPPIILGALPQIHPIACQKSHYAAPHIDVINNLSSAVDYLFVVIIIIKLYINFITYCIAGNFRYLARECSAEMLVGYNICISMPGNHTHQELCM